MASPVLLEGSTRPLARLSMVFINPENGRILAYALGMGRALSPVDCYWKSGQLIARDRKSFINPLELTRVRKFGLSRCIFMRKVARSATTKARFGRVTDLILDTKNDQLLSLEVSRGVFKRTRRLIPAQYIEEVTNTEILLSLEPEQKETLPKKRLLAGST